MCYGSVQHIVYTVDREFSLLQYFRKCPGLRKFNARMFDSHSVSVSTVCRLSFTVKNLSHSSRPNALVHVVAADTQLSFESLHRNFTPVKKFS